MQDVSDCQRYTIDDQQLTVDDLVDLSCQTGKVRNQRVKTRRSLFHRAIHVFAVCPS